MQKFKSKLASAKAQVSGRWASFVEWAREKSLADRVNQGVFIFAFLALLVLVWLYVRPIETANIKVPVATDQASYYPGEEISGIFFGDTYYTGEVRVLREVFCKEYKGIIKPPAGASDGNFFSTQGRPRHLEGQSVVVGNLPSDIPIGLNCVLQFTNVYEIQTPFGIRRIEYQYYTQNFSIVSVERRKQLECEATGRKDCNFINEGANTPANDPIEPSTQSSPETNPVQPVAPSQSNTTTNNSTTNNTTVNNPPAEPAPRFEERCTVDFIVRLNCRQVQVN